MIAGPFSNQKWFYHRQCADLREIDEKAIVLGIDDILLPGIQCPGGEFVLFFRDLPVDRGDRSFFSGTRFEKR